MSTALPAFSARTGPLPKLFSRPSSVLILGTNWFDPTVSGYSRLVGRLCKRKFVMHYLMASKKTTSPTFYAISLTRSPTWGLNRILVRLQPCSLLGPFIFALDFGRARPGLCRAYITSSLLLVRIYFSISIVSIIDHIGRFDPKTFPIDP
nr:hypothetical protein Iba_chr03bCG6050 [Ipomoea batatas]